MTPWTALLESLHSSLIDELNSRFPDKKPELGLPIRQRQPAPPSAAVNAVLACEVSFGPDLGIALIATSTGEKECRELWAAVFKRAGSEFMRRGIKPLLKDPFLLDKTSAGLPAVQRMVWVPFKIGVSEYYLGMGV